MVLSRCPPRTPSVYRQDFQKVVGLRGVTADLLSGSEIRSEEGLRGAGPRRVSLSLASHHRHASNSPLFPLPWFHSSEPTDAGLKPEAK